MASDIQFPPGIRPRGGSIQLDFRFEGVRCRETLKLSPGRKQHVELAANKLAAIKYDIAVGKFNYAEHFPLSKRAAYFGHTVIKNITVKDLLEWYFKQIEGRLRPTTVKAYRGYIDKHIVPGIGQVLARRLKASQVREWLVSDPAKPRAKNNWLAVLRPAFKAALGDDLIDRNPLEAIDNLKVEKTEPNPFSIGDIDLILDGFKINEARYFFEFGFWTGLSPSERLGLQWADIDFEKHCLYIRRAVVAEKVEETKNKFRWRQVDLLPPAENVLLRLRELDIDSAWIFNDPNTQTRWRYEAVRKTWPAALKRAGIARERSYNTRHTYASILLSIGVPLTYIKEQMGHSNYRMLEERYARWIEVPDEHRDRILGWFRQMAQNGHIPATIKPFIESIQ